MALPLPPLPRLSRTQVETALVATLGGAALTLLHVPLAWMIGALLATAAFSWHRDVDFPPWARPAGLVFLGLGLGATFSGPVLAAVTGSLPASPSRLCSASWRGPRRGSACFPPCPAASS